MLTDRELAALVAGFRDQGLITSYLGQLRPGKEAQIHCCRRPDGGYAILKYYTPVALRGFRADAIYGVGTSFVQTRQLRAIRNTSAFGLRVKLELWTANEFRNAARLRGIGIRIPEPLGRLGSALLMRMIGGPDRPAPQLREAQIDPSTANMLLLSLQADILRMLSHNLVHGDLSPYNILLHRGAHWLIDVPQLVDVAVCPDARDLFIRDCRSTLGFLRRCGASVEPDMWAREVWAKRENGHLDV
jgi:RIO kinase 1